jgi:hypothetical protein
MKKFIGLLGVALTVSAPAFAADIAPWPVPPRRLVAVQP